MINKQGKDTKNLIKKARKKYFSYHLAGNLFKLNQSLEKSYKNTLYCASVLEQEDCKITTKYCKNRWCLVCNSIRTAKLINGYLPLINEFKEPYFVTLTVPTCDKIELNNRIKKLQEIWAKIRKLGDWHKIGLKGIKKAECTVRPNEQFHYHFHIILEGEEQAKWLITNWLKYTEDIGSKRIAQDMRPLKSLTNGALELFKYFTKIIVKDKDNERTYIDYEALDIVFTALKGQRVYSTFGGLKSVSEEIDDIRAEDVKNSDRITWIYQKELYDWIDENSGELLTGYVPTKAFKKLVENK